MSRLRAFYQDKLTKAEVFQFLEDCAHDLGGEYAMQGKPTAGFKEFKEILDHAQKEMSDMFEVRNDQLKPNPAK